MRPNSSQEVQLLSKEEKNKKNKTKLKAQVLSIYLLFSDLLIDFDLSLLSCKLSLVFMCYVAGRVYQKALWLVIGFSKKVSVGRDDGIRVVVLEVKFSNAKFVLPVCCLLILVVKLVN